VSPWIGKGVVLAGMAVGVVIRAPHDTRSKQVPVAESRRGAREVALLALVGVGAMLLPLLGLTPLLAFAEYPLRPAAFAAGAALLAVALWLFRRSHADLGDNWSMTLEVREGHRLVTTGIYSHIRHPMYTALFAQAAAQALLFPNWVAGPAFLATFAVMFLLRVRVEERMMVARFGAEYEAYARRTKRLLPGVW
jgi:protein-S-isoprenylcysteine O-methyltransferase Ste14